MLAPPMGGTSGLSLAVRAALARTTRLLCLSAGIGFLSGCASSASTAEPVIGCISLRHECLLAFEERSLDEAEKVCALARDSASWDGSAPNVLGLIRYRRGDLTGARAFFQEAIAREPSLVEAYNNLGVVLMEEGDLASAARYLRQAVAADAGYSAAYASLASVLARMGDAPQASSLLWQCVELDAGGGSLPGEESCLTLLLDYLTTAAHAFPQSDALLRAYVDALAQGAPIYAPPRLQTACDRAPRLASDPASKEQAWCALNPELSALAVPSPLAFCQHAFAREALAIAAGLCRGAAAHADEPPEAYRLVGLIHRQRGELRLAADWLRDAVSLDPEYAEARSDLDAVLRELGEVR